MESYHLHKKCIQLLYLCMGIILLKLNAEYTQHNFNIYNSTIHNIYKQILMSKQMQKTWKKPQQQQQTT